MKMKQILLLAICVLSFDVLVNALEGGKNSGADATVTAVAMISPDPPSDTAASPTSEEAPTSAKAVTPAPSEFIAAAKISAKYKDMAPWHFTVFRVPQPGDEVLGEAGGVRQALAKNHIWFSLYSQPTFDYNLANAPMYGALGAPFNQHIPKGQLEAYSGQKPTYNDGTYMEVTYTIPKTQTQICVGLSYMWTTAYQIQLSKSLKFDDIMINQRFLDKKMTVSVGYLSSGWGTQGIWTGGNLAGSLLGNSSLTDVETGEGTPYSFHPAVMVRYDFPKHLYAIVDVERSNNPNVSVASYSAHTSPLWLPFAEKGAKAFTLTELGYKREASPKAKKLWERFNTFYNFSHYTDFRTFKKTDNNFGFQNAVDLQITQPDLGLPFRGWYLGNTLAYAAPQQNLYTQYYEARAYNVGFFRSRPQDMVTFMANYIGFSKTVARVLAAGRTYDDGQVNAAATYVAHLKRGVWLNVGLDHVNHPTYAPKTPTALVFRSQMSIFF